MDEDGGGMDEDRVGMKEDDGELEDADELFEDAGPEKQNQEFHEMRTDPHSRLDRKQDVEHCPLRG